jgi:hypothetical protein
MSDPLAIDPAQIARFVHAMFPHASEGGFVSVRAFYDDELAKRRHEGPFKIRTVRLDGEGLGPVVKAATKLAEEAALAARPVVVCPPLATFLSGKAAEKDLREGLGLSVEMDERAAEALAKLRPVIGQPTLVVASGGMSTDPETGEVQPKLHAHWRLNEPTQTPDEHALLKRARSLACKLVGADATSNPVVHPIRWAGTLHRKNPDAPRLATIVEENPGSEISLDDVLSELEELESLRGEAGEERAQDAYQDPTGDADLLMACAPNGSPTLTSIGRPGTAWAWRSGGPAEAARPVSPHSTCSRARVRNTTLPQRAPDGSISRPGRPSGWASARWSMKPAKRTRAFAGEARPRARRGACR